ncbi:MAG: hypothetical protein FWG73_06545 [Planctomycetaceae bacterium]|nr:hypothetical protein [Planctomycetaceae bacterium]
MTLDEVLQNVRVGDSFYRSAKPDILYERIGALIERNGLGWATLKRTHNCEWEIMAEMNDAVDNSATDWTLQRDERLKDFDPKAKAPKLRSRFTQSIRLEPME